MHGTPDGRMRAEETRIHVRVTIRARCPCSGRETRRAAPSQDNCDDTAR